MKIKWMMAWVLTGAMLGLICGATFRSVKPEEQEQANFVFQRLNPFPPFVSMRELVAHPRRYDQMKVRTLGFVQDQFESRAIYTTGEDLYNRNYENSLHLTHFTNGDKINPRDIDEKYCEVVGFVKSGTSGHLGHWNAAFDIVDKVEILADINPKQ